MSRAPNRASGGRGRTLVVAAVVLAATIGVARADLAALPAPVSDPVATPPAPIGKYTPDAGFTVADTDKGQLVIRIYAYVRYLNQLALDPSYVDAFGQTKSVKQRQDIELNKVNIYFIGWVLSPKFRYVSYVWTANATQGLGAQVVVGGNLAYVVNEHFGVYAGIGALPGTRSTEGNFPRWLGVEERLIADEFFRPSYTSGVWVKGKIVDSLRYHVMLGNNMSQLGIDAGQLDNKLDTLSAAINWTPTTGEFGTLNGFGDFDDHQKVATRLGAHFTHSDENQQSQPNTEAIDNSQIRLSDGSVVFTPDLFGPGIDVTDVTVWMTSVDAGAKYRGFALEGEYYYRWIDNLRGPGTETLPFSTLRDSGFQLQASAMVLPQTLQAYLSGSKIFGGQYGDPWDARVGANWFPFHSPVVRVNTEMIYLRHSPVGALSLPYTVGGNGPVFHTNVELYF